MPWEPGWEAGDQTVAANRTAKNKMEGLSESLSAAKTLESIKLQVRQHFKTLKELGYVDDDPDGPWVNIKIDNKEIYNIKYEFNVTTGYLEENSINEQFSVFEPQGTVKDANVGSSVDYTYKLKVSQEGIDELEKKWKDAKAAEDALIEELNKALKGGQGTTYVAGTTSIPHVYLHLGTAKLKAGNWRDRDHRLPDGTKVEVISKGEDESFNRTEDPIYHWWYVTAWKDGSNQSPIQGWVMQVLINKDC